MTEAPCQLNSFPGDGQPLARIGDPHRVAQVEASPHLGGRQGVLLGEGERSLQEGLGLAHPPQAAAGRCLRDHALGDHRHHVESLRSVQGPVGPFDRQAVLLGAHVRLGKPSMEHDERRIRADVTKDLERPLNLGHGLFDEAVAQQ